MKIFRCDRCKTQADAFEAEDFATDWETVVVTGLNPYHLCEACAALLFRFIKGEATPGTSNASEPAQEPLTGGKKSEPA